MFLSTKNLKKFALKLDFNLWITETFANLTKHFEYHRHINRDIFGISDDTV